jgi:hypothetical protein
MGVLLGASLHDLKEKFSDEQHHNRLSVRGFGSPSLRAV